MRDDNYNASDIKILPGLEPPKRVRWQLRMAGDAAYAFPPSRATGDALTQILDRLPHVRSVTLKTAHGDVAVTREFPSEYLDNISDLVASIFQNDPQIIAIEFPEHTATPEDPHDSPLGKAIKAIRDAARSGEITSAEAIRKLKKLFPGEPDNGA